jgi:hypothetical protein
MFHSGAVLYCTVRVLLMIAYEHLNEAHEIVLELLKCLQSV